jgi:hypothetical protein
MAKKNEAKSEAKSESKHDGKKSGRKLLEAARAHQDALQAAGLSGSTIDKYETALKGIEAEGKELNAASQTLVKDISRAVAEFQGAIRKEFPNNTSFQAFFKANEPLPESAHALLALAREVAKQAPEFSSNLIKHALNAASVKHLSFLCDQLEGEIGTADTRAQAADLEKVILEIAQRAFEGKPELAAFK